MPLGGMKDQYSGGIAQKRPLRLLSSDLLHQYVMKNLRE